MHYNPCTNLSTENKQKIRLKKHVSQKHVSQKSLNCTKDDSRDIKVMEIKGDTAKISERVMVEITKHMENVFGEFKEDATKQVMFLMKQIIRKATEDTNKS